MQTVQTIKKEEYKNKTPKRKPFIYTKEKGKYTVLLPRDKIVLLKGVEMKIWDCCDGKKKISQIAASLAENKQNRRQVIEFIIKLSEKGLVDV